MSPGKVIHSHGPVVPGLDGAGDRMVLELRSATLWRDVCVELLATFVFVGLVTSAGLRWDRGEDSSLLIALTSGFGAVAIIEAFSAYGGAHFNPAVTMAYLVAGQLTITRALFYCIAQLLGGICGAAFTYGSVSEHRRGDLGMTRVNPELDDWQAVVMEAYLTGLLVVAVIGSQNKHRRTIYMASFPIGLAYAVCAMAGHYYTGGSVNPVRSLAPAIIIGDMNRHWIYWIGPMVGSILATVFYHYMLERVDRVAPPPPEPATVPPHEHAHVVVVEPGVPFHSHPPSIIY